MATLTIDGTGGDDAIVITASGTDSGSYSVNGGPAVAFSGVTQVAVSGGAGNDTLTIVNPDDSLFAPAGGINYQGGGQSGDALAIVGGAASNASLAAGATPDAGTLTHTSGAITQTIAFAGIAPIIDAVAAASLTINGTAGTDTITVTDGGPLGGVQTTTVSSNTFESITFANKTTVTIDGHGGSDTVSFNNPNPAAGMTTLSVQGVGSVTQSGAVKVANLSIGAIGNVTLDNAGNQVGTLAASGAGGTFSFTDASPLIIGTVGAVTGITTLHGAVTLTADNLDIQQQINVNGGTTVTLQPLSAGRTISLGGADSASVLGLTDEELDHVTTTTLRIGKSDAGTIRLDAAINPAGTNQLELTTAADIQDDNAVGTDLSIARLAMTAGTGLGVTGTSGALETAVGQIEAQTTTGGLGISNTGDVTIGGLTPALGGLHVVSSGNLNFTTDGSITLADTDGAATVGGGGSSGNVALTANGASAIVSSTVNQIAIMAPAGSVSVTAGVHIELGIGGTNFNNDVLADGSVTLVAGQVLVIDGNADVTSDAFGHNTGGGVTAIANNSLQVTDFQGTNASIGAAGTAGGSVTLSTPDLILFAPNPGAVFSNSGDVTVNANGLNIQTSGIAAPAAGHSVTIEPMSPAWAINLGSNPGTTSTLGLLDTELDRITTPTLRIGSATNTGDITVSSQITSDGHYDTLSLRSGGAILDGTATDQTDITVNNLALQAATGIGSFDDMDVAVSKLAFNDSISGNVNVTNAAGLTIGAVDGLAASSAAGGEATVGATGPLTAAASVAALNQVELFTHDTPASGDDITVLSGVAIQSPTFVQLFAGDNLTLQPGSIVQAGVGQFNVDGSADPGVGATASLNGTVIAPFVQIVGNADADVLHGTPVADQLNGGAGADVMIGGAGDDSYFVDNAGDAVIENPGEGTDTVDASINFGLPANVENLTLGGVGDLQGFGNGLANTITGNNGNNLIDGGAGADVMQGGAGNDTYFVDNSGDAVIENASQGNDTVFATVNFTLPGNVENLILQGGTNLQGFGNNQANVIYGNAGNNLIDGGAGIDLMVGGAGNDTYFVDDPSDAAFENPGEGNDTVFTTANYGLAANVETLVMQGGGDLQGYGNNQANVIYGNAGNNLINGAGGIDLMVGGAGNDTYFVDDPSDSCFEGAGQGNDAVFASCNYGLSADIETLVMQGTGDFQSYGNNQANTLYGNSGNNLLNGAGGADTMIGGVGNDTYFVDNVGDMVVENAGEGTDVVLSGVSYTLSANVEALVLQGAGNLAGTGNGQANNIFGNSGDNVLDGGAGADELTGDAGNDTFTFHAGEADGDTVVDFAGNGAAAGDSLHFIGYGAGATFTQNDATHWQVNFNGASHEVITFMNGAIIDPSDVLFS